MILCVDVLPAHALTGCDQVPMLHGIGKLTMLKTLKEHKHSLSLLGDLSANFEDVVSQATKFIGSCYGIHNAISMTDVRVKTWIKKTGRKTTAKVPKLSSLPPTSEAFRENVKRAHLQSALWKAALRDPPCVDPCDFGWEKVEETRTLQLIGLPASAQPAPDYIMKIVCCSCASDTPCKIRSCGCVAANLACTMFCKCEGSSFCHNEQTIEADCNEDTEPEDDL